MLGGMTVGMLLGMWIRYAVFEHQAPQQKAGSNAPLQ